MTDVQTDLITEESIATYLAGPPPESADFVFLLGRWTTETVRYDPAGRERIRLRGLWTARMLHGDRVVLDETVSLDDAGREVASMATLRSYCPATGQWEMVFLVAHQPILPIRFVGRRVGRELHLEASLLTDAESPLRVRVRFYDVCEDAFAWEQEMSFDAGATFVRTVSIRAKRAST